MPHSCCSCCTWAPVWETRQGKNLLPQRADRCSDRTKSDRAQAELEKAAEKVGEVTSSLTRTQGRAGMGQKASENSTGSCGGAAGMKAGRSRVGWWVGWQGCRCRTKWWPTDHSNMPGAVIKFWRTNDRKARTLRTERRSRLCAHTGQ